MTNRSNKEALFPVRKSSNPSTLSSVNGEAIDASSSIEVHSQAMQKVVPMYQGLNRHPAEIIHGTPLRAEGGESHACDSVCHGGVELLSLLFALAGMTPGEFPESLYDLLVDILSEKMAVYKEDLEIEERTRGHWEAFLRSAGLPVGWANSLVAGWLDADETNYPYCRDERHWQDLEMAKFGLMAAADRQMCRAAYPAQRGLTPLAGNEDEHIRRSPVCPMLRSLSNQFQGTLPSHQDERFDATQYLTLAMPGDQTWGLRLDYIAESRIRGLQIVRRSKSLPGHIAGHIEALFWREMHFYKSELERLGRGAKWPSFVRQLAPGDALEAVNTRIALAAL